MSNRTSTDSPNFTLLALAWLLLAAGLSIVLVRNPVAGIAIGVTILFLVGATLSSRFSQAMIAILFFELILGGDGHLVDFWNVVSLRMMLFGLLLLCFLIAILSGRRPKDIGWERLRACWLGLLFGTGTFFFFGLVMGTIHRNPLRFIVPDAYGYFFLVAAIPIYCLSGRKSPSLKFVAFSFLSAVFVFSAIKAVFYVAFKLNILSLGNIVQIITSTMSQSVATRGAYGSQRIAIVGDLFPAFALPIFLALANFAKTKRLRVVAYAASLIVGIALLASGTRGLWLGAMCGILVVALVSGARVGLKILVGVAVVSLLVVTYFPDIATSAAQRFELSFNFSEPSNYIRVEQVGPLMAKAEQHIVLGNGYGATVPGLLRNYESPYSFELQTVALLMKMGIVGCGLWIWFLTWVLWDLWRTSRATKSRLDRALAEGIIGGIIALLAASNTDPYFQAATGMGCLTFSIVMADMLRNHINLRPAPKEEGNGKHTDKSGRRIPFGATPLGPPAKVDY